MRLLGTGGMGSVFLARDPALKRLVAVKVLAPALAADPGARARFEREAQAVARLSHPNVVAIHSVGQLVDGTPYFVMQHVAGNSLSARLAEEGPFLSDEAGRILGEVASALAAAHALGIIHRDIKPANVLYDAESDRVLVSDFGIAAVRPKAGQPVETKLTMTGMAVGTPQYMSPEQLLAEDVTEKTDVYALGLLGYELLSGSGPFQATSPQELIAAHLRDTPKPLSEIRDDVDPELESAVAQCLAKDPDQRPSARDIAQRFTLGADRMLEWPPPGLGTLHRQLLPVANLFAVGSTLVAVSFLALMWLGAQLSLMSSSIATLFIWLGGAAGAFALLAVVMRLLKLGKAATIAVRAGFGWLTVAETLGDRRGDTGALIAGVREYAGLHATERARLRSTRLAVEATLLGAALMPLLLIVPFIWLGSLDLVAPGAAPLFLLLPSLVFVVLAQVGQQREIRAVGAGRARLRKHRKTREEDPSVVRTWNETLNDVRRGQSLGAGSAAHPLLGRLVTVGAGLALLLVIIVVTPIGLIGVMGPTLVRAGAPEYSGTTEKLELANTARSFAVPADSTISPLEGGRAFYALSHLGRSMPRTSSYPQQPLPVVFEKEWFSQRTSDDLFQRDSASPGTHNAWSPVLNAPALNSVIEYAADGLTAAEFAYLEAVATHPAWGALRTVARAPTVDFIGGRYVLPFPENVSWGDMPILPFAATKEAAYASVSKAAFFLAQGREDEAEVTLRETLSYGFALIDDGRNLIDVLVGVVIVGMGRDGLERLYGAMGRPEAAVLRARYDSVVTRTEERNQLTTGVRLNDVDQLRLSMLTVATDTSQLRGFRVEALFALSLAPCSNVRELLFGLNDDIEAAFTQADSELVRFESDRELLRLIRETSERGVGEGPADNSAFKLARGIARVAGWVLGNKRIVGCTVWVTQG